MLKYLKIVAQVVAIPAFVIALWNFIYPMTAQTKIALVPERQVQLMQDTIDGKSMTAFNILSTILATGPAQRWETVRFNSATIRVPDGRTINFSCRAYLTEIGRGQQNQSRNIPIAIKGGESMTITSAYQSDELPSWILGEYNFTINAIDSKGRTVTFPSFKITLSQHDLDIINKPLSIYMKEIQ